MKVSRSTSRPRRLGRHRSGGSWVAIVSLLVLVGGGTFVGNELGWWSPKKPADGPSGQAKLGSRLPASESRIAEAPRPVEPSAPSTATSAPLSHDSVVPSGTAFTAPRFGKDFEDALTRGDFRAAEAALANIGGAADA